MTWQLVNSIGSNERLMINKRIFFELSFKNGRLLSNTALGISRLYKTEIFEIVKSRNSASSKTIRSQVKRTYLQLDFVAVPTVVEYLHEQTQRVGRCFHKFRAKFHYRQSIKIETHGSGAYQKLHRHDHFEVIVHHRCESVIYFPRYITMYCESLLIYEKYT